jgi:hypothetical protein
MCGGCPKKKHQPVLDPTGHTARCAICKRPLVLVGTEMKHE